MTKQWLAFVTLCVLLSLLQTSSALLTSAKIRDSRPLMSDGAPSIITIADSDFLETISTQNISTKRADDSLQFDKDELVHVYRHMPPANVEHGNGKHRPPASSYFYSLPRHHKPFSSHESPFNNRKTFHGPAKQRQRPKSGLKPYSKLPQVARAHRKYHLFEYHQHSPPTPPDIKYDGWQPLPGLVARPADGSQKQQLPELFHGLSSLSLGSSYGSSAGISDSYGAPLNTVTGSGGVVSSSGDAHIAHIKSHEHQATISLGLTAAGIENTRDASLSVIKSIGYEIFPKSKSSSAVEFGNELTLPSSNMGLIPPSSMWYVESLRGNDHTVLESSSSAPPLYASYKLQPSAPQSTVHHTSFPSNTDADGFFSSPSDIDLFSAGATIDATQYAVPNARTQHARNCMPASYAQASEHVSTPPPSSSGALISSQQAPLLQAAKAPLYTTLRIQSGPADDLQAALLPQDHVVNDGLLQSILAAIEQPDEHSQQRDTVLQRRLPFERAPLPIGQTSVQLAESSSASPLFTDNDIALYVNHNHIGTIHDSTSENLKTFSPI